MKIFQPLAVSMIALASASANSAITYSDVAYGAADAQAAETNFLNELLNWTTETFEGNFTAAGETSGTTIIGNVAADSSGIIEGHSWLLAAETFNTSVGSFTMTTPETNLTGSDMHPELLMLENDQTGEFGRMESYDSQWLDSNDADAVSWDIAGAGDSIGFYLSDANDQGASLRLIFDDGTEHIEQLDSNLANGNLMYISFMSDIAITGAELVFDNGTNNNDGWGIDNVTVGKVPEPASIALLGLGLLGLGASRRRAKKA